jgi:1-acyl-sn-glycerol-3-phosphate acyltransferase
MFGRLLRALSVAAARRYYRIEVSGPAPRRGPAIVAANHIHRFEDALVIACALRPTIRFLAHRDLLGLPLLGWILKSGTDVLVGDALGDLEDAVVRCGEIARRGELVGVFPEGRRLGEGRFRDGAAYLAARIGCPVVPARVEALGRRRYRVAFGAPRPPPGDRADRRRQRALTLALREEIEAL